MKYTITIRNIDGYADLNTEIEVDMKGTEFAEGVLVALAYRFGLKKCDGCGKLSVDVTKAKWPTDLTAEPYDMCNECAEDMSSEFAVWTQ